MREFNDSLIRDKNRALYQTGHPGTLPLTQRKFCGGRFAEARCIRWTEARRQRQKHLLLQNKI